MPAKSRFGIENDSDEEATPTKSSKKSSFHEKLQKKKDQGEDDSGKTPKTAKKKKISLAEQFKQQKAAKEGAI